MKDEQKNRAGHPAGPAGPGPGNPPDSVNLEDSLRAALRRREPSAGFAERIVARSSGEVNVGQPVLGRSRRGWTWAAVAAMLIAGIALGLVSGRVGWFGSGTEEVAQVQAVRATEQAILALRIASDKLNAARAKVVGSGANTVCGEPRPVGADCGLE